MKIFLIITLIVVIMLIAVSVSEQYKDRYDFYFNLKLFLTQLKLNISFRADKLDKFLQQIKPKKNFKIFIAAYQEYLKTTKLDLSQLKILDEDERQELHDIVTNIGKMDKTNEVKQIEGFVLSIEEKQNQALQAKTKLCPMIIKLSLLFALAVAIVLC